MKSKPPDAPASPKSDMFTSGLTEFEYGALAWWTTEFYLDGQTTANQSTIFTGYRWENRFRVLMREHIINPVLYVEFEDINGADKTLKEVVGFDSQEDGLVPNSIARQDKQRELETKLILSSNVGGWNNCGELYRREEPRRRPLGVRLFGGFQPSTSAHGFSQRVRLVPGELSGWCRVLRRVGRRE